MSVRPRAVAKEETDDYEACSGRRMRGPYRLARVRAVAGSGRRRTRRRRSGLLDPSFGSGGQVAISTAFAPQAVLVQPNGAILVAASTQLGASEVLRFQSNGQVDGSFGSGGVATLGMSVVASLALQADGKIVAAGRTASGSAQVTRLASNGSADASFGKRGVVNFAFAPNGIVSSAATTVLVQPDGKLLVGGLALAASADLYYTSLARFDAAGKPDAGFGEGGFVLSDLVGGITALGLQADGKIVVCGGFISPVTDLVVRFLADGTLDGSVGGGGALTAATHDPLLFEGTNVFQPDVKVVQWSKVSDGSKTQAQVARVLRTFAPDTSFRSAPFAFGSPSSCCNVPNDVEVQPDGKLIVGGYAVGTSGNASSGSRGCYPAAASIAPQHLGRDHTVYQPAASVVRRARPYRRLTGSQLNVHPALPSHGHARHRCVHRISFRVRDDRDTALCGTRQDEVCAVSDKSKQEYFHNAR